MTNCLTVSGPRRSVRRAASSGRACRNSFAQASVRARTTKTPSARHSCCVARASAGPAAIAPRERRPWRPLSAAVEDASQGESGCGAEWFHGGGPRRGAERPIITPPRRRSRSTAMMPAACDWSSRPRRRVGASCSPRRGWTFTWIRWRQTRAARRRSSRGVRGTGGAHKGHGGAGAASGRCRPRRRHHRGRRWPDAREAGRRRRMPRECSGGCPVAGTTSSPGSRWPGRAGAARRRADPRVVCAVVGRGDYWICPERRAHGQRRGVRDSGVGASFVLRVEGSYSNVVGLPVAAVLQVLRDAGLNADHRAVRGVTAGLTELIPSSNWAVFWGSWGPATSSAMGTEWSRDVEKSHRAVISAAVLMTALTMR